MTSPAAARRSRATSRRDRWRRRGLISLVVVVVVALIAIPLRHRGVAAITVADALELPVPRPFAADVERRSTTLSEVEVDVYGTPGAGETALETEDADVLLLVPGAAPDGREDARLVRLAEAFARSGKVVVVPELEVYQEDLVLEDLERLVRVIQATAEEHGPVAVAGISFGASLSLIAAGDERVRDQVALVGTFGAYADLAGIVQAATTGVSLVEGERFRWQPDPRAEQVVRDQLLGLLPSEAAAALDEALQREDPDALPQPLRVAYDLLTADDPAQVMAIIEDAPQPIRERLTAVSPVRAVPDLDVPIVAMHARDDPVIPYGELYRLGAQYPQAELISLQTFDHVGLDPDAEPSWWVTARDLWSTTVFVEEILRASERG